MKWQLTVTVEAEDENEARHKFMDKIMYMLVNNVEKEGSAVLKLERVRS